VFVAASAARRFRAPNGLSGQIEFSIFRAADEGVPLSAREGQDRTLALSLGGCRAQLISGGWFGGHTGERERGRRSGGNSGVPGRRTGPGRSSRRDGTGADRCVRHRRDWSRPRRCRCGNGRGRRANLLPHRATGAMNAGVRAGRLGLKAKWRNALRRGRASDETTVCDDSESDWHSHARVGGSALSGPPRRRSRGVRAVRRTRAVPGAFARRVGRGGSRGRSALV
jgi:hypothetical protein